MECSGKPAAAPFRKGPPLAPGGLVFRPPEPDPPPGAPSRANGICAPPFSPASWGGAAPPFSLALRGAARRPQGSRHCLRDQTRPDRNRLGTRTRLGRQTSGAGGRANSTCEPRHACPSLCFGGYGSSCSLIRSNLAGREFHHEQKRRCRGQGVSSLAENKHLGPRYNIPVLGFLRWGIAVGP